MTVLIASHSRGNCTCSVTDALRESVCVMLFRQWVCTDRLAVLTLCLWCITEIFSNFMKVLSNIRLAVSEISMKNSTWILKLADSIYTLSSSWECWNSIRNLWISNSSWIFRVNNMNFSWAFFIGLHWCHKAREWLLHTGVTWSQRIKINEKDIIIWLCNQTKSE